MYSQNDEEAVILKFFSAHPPGNLLDIGAYDGVQLSNTRALLEAGWSGTLVEPDPANLAQLQANCRLLKLPVKIIAAAVAHPTAPILGRLYQSKDPLRAWNTSLTASLVTNPSSQELYVPTICMEDLTQWGPYDFINIDAEGEDLSILSLLTPSILRPCELICIEPFDSEQRPAMKELLGSFGFETIHETPENIIAARK
jgi:FkbM family methyltransferase